MFDASEIHALAAEQRIAADWVMAAIVPVAGRAGQNIKAGIRRSASGHTRLPHLSRAVSYDVNVSPTRVEVEVGFDQSGQGNLANIAVYGTSKTAPFVDIDSPLQAEVPNFMRWVAKVGAEAL